MTPYLVVGEFLAVGLLDAAAGKANSFALGGLTAAGADALASETLGVSLHLILVHLVLRSSSIRTTLDPVASGGSLFLEKGTYGHG